MSQLQQYRAFAHYNQLMNQRLYAQTDTLTDVERKAARGAYFGSIHGTLNHLLVGDVLWFGRFRAGGLATNALQGLLLLDTPVTSLGDTLFADYEELKAARFEFDHAIVRWADQLKQTDVDSKLTYFNIAGQPKSHAAWIAISQVFNHQTHHRGQITTLLSQLGLDIGVTDFLPHTLAWQPDW